MQVIAFFYFICLSARSEINQISLSVEMSINFSQSGVTNKGNPLSALEALRCNDHGAFCEALKDRLVDLELCNPETKLSVLEEVLKKPKAAEFIKTCAKYVKFNEVKLQSKTECSTKLYSV